jgi:hypothetical protein
MLEIVQGYEIERVLKDCTKKPEGQREKPPWRSGFSGRRGKSAKTGE